MPIPGFITKDDYEKLPDPLKEAYVEDGERMRLDVAGSDGWAFENISGLRSAHERDKHGRKSAESALAAWQQLQATPEDAAEAIRKASELGKYTPPDKVSEQIEAARAAVLKEAKAREDALQAELQAAMGQLQETIVDGALATAIAKHGGNSTVLLPALRGQLKMDRDEKAGKYVARVMDGDIPRVSHKDREGYMSPDELVESLKAQDDWSAAFNGHGAVGAGTQGSRRVGANPGIAIKRSEIDNPTRFQEVAKQAAEAGIPVADIPVVDG